MGMFDYVKYDGECGKCKTPISEWQSKDAGCVLDYLEPKDVKIFYANCKKCDTWNQMEVKSLVIKIVRTIPEDKYPQPTSTKE